MERLVQQLNSIYHISNHAENALKEVFTKKALMKTEFLAKEKSICKNLYFLESGCVRGYYFSEDKEITHWFGFENDFITSFQSFITEKPSLENIQAVEDCIVYGISRDALYNLYNKFPEIERLGRITCEKYYLRLEERYVNAQFKTATERYQQLLEVNPSILQRLPLGLIASYLGISQETLSRIRSKKV